MYLRIKRRKGLGRGCQDGGSIPPSSTKSTSVRRSNILQTDDSEDSAGCAFDGGDMVSIGRRTAQDSLVNKDFKMKI